MLPKELGGVVDANLKVYGLANVRVADSSVFPIQFAAHVRPGRYAISSLPTLLNISFPVDGANLRPRRTSSRHHSRAV